MFQIAQITSKRIGYPLHVELETEHTRTIDVWNMLKNFKVIDVATRDSVGTCKKIIGSF